MAGLTVSQLNDLVKTTLESLDKPNFQDIAQDLTSYPAFDMLVRGKRVAKDTGKSISRRIAFDYAETSRFVGLYENDQPQVKDVVANAAWAWSHSTNSYSVNRREILMQGGSRKQTLVKLTDLLKLRRHQALVAEAERYEPALWGKPSTSADVLTPHGVKSYVVAATVATPTPTLGGGNPTGFSSGVGVDSGTYPKWKNWQATYSQFSNADLIEKMRVIMYKSNFTKAPKTSPSDHATPSDLCQVYAGVDAVVGIENLLLTQNDNLGMDAAPTFGRAMLFRSKLNHIPALDDDTTNPVYMLNWGVMEFVVLEGDYFTEQEPVKHPYQHDTSVVYIDNTFQFICLDRRRQAVLNQVA